MLWSTIRINAAKLSHLELKTYVLKAARWFWKFSNFYGDYASLPPSERSRMVETYLSNAKKHKRHHTPNQL
jgi:hypothetical protein